MKHGSPRGKSISPAGKINWAEIARKILKTVEVMLAAIIFMALVALALKKEKEKR